MLIQNDIDGTTDLIVASNDLELLDGMKNIDWHAVTVSEAESFSMALSHFRSAEQAYNSYKVQAKETRYLMLSIYTCIVIAAFLGASGFSIAAGVCCALLLKLIYDLLRAKGTKKIVDLNRDNLLAEITAVVDRQETGKVPTEKA